MGFSTGSGGGGGGGGGGPQDNLNAIIDPTVNDDIDLGYVVGSHWVNVILDKTFVCVNNDDGAAIWNQVDAVVVTILSNLSAAINPTVNDDIDLGYVVGSHWINIVLDTTFICVNNSDGAAIWNQVDTIAAATIKNNFVTAGDPSETDDSDSGYEAGSRWINVATDTLFTCVDATVGIAVWDEHQIVGAAAVVDGWRVDNARYNGVFFDLTGQTGQMTSVTFSRDGTRMYILDTSTTNVILQYNLSTEFDINTAVYASLSYTATELNNATGAYFSDDGTKMFLTETTTNDGVYQYTLSTPWKIDTATYDSIFFDSSNESVSPSDIFLGDGGTKMYLIDGAAPDSVYQYNLGTPWDISTASYSGNSISITAVDVDPGGIVLRDDGSKMFFAGTFNDSIYAYTLSTPWDISTATYDGDSFAFTSLETNVQGLAVNDDGKKMFVVGNGSDNVYEILTSSTDNLTGEVWSDGKPIWRTIIVVPDSGVGGSDTISLGSTVDSLIDIGGYVIRNSDSAKLPLPHVDAAANLNVSAYINAAGTDVIITSGSSQNHNGGFVWIEYTK